MCMHTILCNVNIDVQYLLNQAGAGPRLVHSWFLEIALVHASVCVCVCVSAPEGINNQWCDMV